MSKFKEMLDALNQGKIVAIEEDRQTGEIVYGGAFDDDSDAALSYSADSPEGMAVIPKVVFVKGSHELKPRYQL